MVQFDHGLSSPIPSTLPHPTPRRAGPLILASIALTVLVSACGEDGDDAAAVQSFRDQANGVCAEAGVAIGAAIGEAFQAGEPTPEQLQAALDTVVTVSRRPVRRHRSTRRTIVDR